MYHPMVLFLPLLNKSIAPSWVWGHQLVTLDILGATSSWLVFLSCMFFHHHWTLSYVLQKSFPSCRQSSFHDSRWIPDRCVRGSFAADAGLTFTL